MPKPSLKATTETTVVQEVKLQPLARQMLVKRLQEHATLAALVMEKKGTKKKPGRMRRIEAEVSDIFRKEKQGKALVAGTAISGHSLKLTTGKTKRFDQMGFMKKHGLAQEDFDEFTTYSDNEPFLRFTHPGVDDSE